MKSRKRIKNRHFEQSYRQRLVEIDNRIIKLRERFPFLSDSELRLEKLKQIDKLQCQQRVKWREHHPILFYGQNTCKK